MSIATYWLIFGFILAISEIVLPGGIVIFLGGSAIIVSLSMYLNLITDFPTAMITWFILSLINLFALRSLFIKYFEGDSYIDSVDSRSEIKGALVEVTEDIQPHKPGRVRFRDTSWIARSEATLLKGEQARILDKDGNHLIVHSIL